MKNSKLILAAIAMSAPFAQAVTVNITGSTAFRSVTHAAIVAAFDAGTCTAAVQTGTTTATAATASQLSGAGKVCFKGTIGAVAHTVNCNWSGSINGLKDVKASPATTAGWVDPATATFGACNGTSTFGTAKSNNATVSVTPTVACSDVYADSAIALDPTVAGVTFEEAIGGVIPFKWVAQESALNANITNITDQLHELLFSGGTVDLSVVTGNPADAGNTVYATGRDNGSGTRGTQLAETRYGVARIVAQYRPSTVVAATATLPGLNGSIAELRVWPGTAQEASPPANTLNHANEGNGGFTSGGSVANALSSTMAATVTLKNGTGTTLGTVPGSSIILVAHLGLGDALTAVNNGGKELTYNGVAFSTDNVRNGKYTEWGYLHVYNKAGTLSTGANSQTSVRDAIIAQMGANMQPFGAAAPSGIDVNTMLVSRSEDGGLVGP
ncbi:MAG: hypothetical protein K1X78_09435 [Verrucomicrobiaceae bacterium]|nr:hypothetical protein [Verrucomicrobiaceae bacterium]